MARRGSITVALEVKSVRETRDRIPGFLDDVRSGTEIAPEIFGAHRKPEAVLLSYRAYVDLLEELDDLAISRTVRERDETRGEEFIELDDAMRSLGFDPDEHSLA